MVIVPARQATQPGGIGSLESILGLLKSLKFGLRKPVACIVLTLLWRIAPIWTHVYRFPIISDGHYMINYAYSIMRYSSIVYKCTYMIGIMMARCILLTRVY